jgi:hypothetical protein
MQIKKRLFLADVDTWQLRRVEIVNPGEGCIRSGLPREDYHHDVTIDKKDNKLKRRPLHRFPDCPPVEMQFANRNACRPDWLQARLSYGGLSPGDGDGDGACACCAGCEGMRAATLQPSSFGGECKSGASAMAT